MLKAKTPSKRLFLINRDFQLRYTRIAVTVGLCSTVLTLALILMPLFQLRVLRFPNFMPIPFMVALGVAAVLNFLIVAWMGVMITHRIAGPMFSLVRHIRMVQTGRLQPPLKVRESDDLKYVVRNFNELLEGLAEQTRRDRERLELVQKALAEPGGTAKAQALVEELRAEFDERLAPVERRGVETVETA